MNIKAKFLVILLILLTLVLYTPNIYVYSQETFIGERERTGALLEDLNIEIEYQNLKQLRHKNFDFEFDDNRKLCFKIVVGYVIHRQKWAVDANYQNDCSIKWYKDEYPYAPTELVKIGPEYAEAVNYFSNAIEARVEEESGPFYYEHRTEEGLNLIRLGLLSFLSVRFPNNPVYVSQLEKWLPTSTPTITITPTSTSTPTPTQTFTPTSTPTSTPTLTLTSTPKPTVTPTPTQATLLIMTNNFINDLQAGENNYLLVIIVLIILLVFIGIGVLINKQLRRKETIR